MYAVELRGLQQIEYCISCVAAGVVSQRGLLRRAAVLPDSGGHQTQSRFLDPPLHGWLSWWNVKRRDLAENYRFSLDFLVRSGLFGNLVRKLQVICTLSMTRRELWSRRGLLIGSGRESCAATVLGKRDMHGMVTHCRLRSLANVAGSGGSRYYSTLVFLGCQLQAIDHFAKHAYQLDYRNRITSTFLQENIRTDGLCAGIPDLSKLSICRLSGWERMSATAEYVRKRTHLSTIS